MLLELLEKGEIEVNDCPAYCDNWCVCQCYPEGLYPVVGFAER